MKDLKIAMERLQDELDGLYEYEEGIKYVEDPKLKDLLKNIHNVEKSHATALLNYINEYAKAVL